MRIILSENGTFYKANLHCHTTCSDGELTPEQVRELYRANGYSVIAFTDHDRYIPHPELKTDDFLPLYAFEYGVTEQGKPFALSRVCHLCCIALNESIRTQPLWYERSSFSRTVHTPETLLLDENSVKIDNEYGPETVNAVIAHMKKNNFFVTYNHPVWSLESYPEYSRYEGMDAIEMVNYGCATAGWLEYNEQPYGDLLKQGKRLFCIAADDNHNQVPPTDASYDSLGGYVMIQAEALTYPAVADALRTGRFYASEGPEIRSLTYDEETKTVRVTTSPVARIICVSDARRGRVADRTREGLNVTEASFTLGEFDSYVRIVLVDGQGRRAWSNPIFDL